MDCEMANGIMKLPAALRAEAEKAAKADGTSLETFVSLAVAEKLSAIRTGDFFRRRARNVGAREALAALDRISGNEPPREGDELPPAWRPKAAVTARKTARRSR